MCHLQPIVPGAILCNYEHCVCVCVFVCWRESAAVVALIRTSKPQSIIKANTVNGAALLSCSFDLFTSVCVRC